MGEMDYDAIVTLPKCGKCANPLPEENVKAPHITSKHQNSSIQHKVH